MGMSKTKGVTSRTGCIGIKGKECIGNDVVCVCSLYDGLRGMSKANGGMS